MFLYNIVSGQLALLLIINDRMGHGGTDMMFTITRHYMCTMGHTRHEERAVRRQAPLMTND